MNQDFENRVFLGKNLKYILLEFNQPGHENRDDEERKKDQEDCTRSVYQGFYDGLFYHRLS